MVRLQIESADDGEGTGSFFRWLGEDPAAGRAMTVTLADAEAEPGQMGAGDVITAVLTQLTGLGTLALAFAAWRDSRAHTPTMKITIGDASIEVGAESVEQLTVALTALADKQPAAAPDPGE